ncbi:hypothetical protein E8E13_000377 [Curvularia kusanoi]|uniref:Uncharacterized protein n=1 Tax=Curvularia kusanoi TaxID=90978 RepID=A0A9P4W5N2_CURKU|nr:hypothetical protein E8E13_000377 [Curvularia kusanoi]
MFPEKLRSSLVFLAMFQWHYGFGVTAESTDGIIMRRDDALADFGQTVPILGRMERTDQDFKDGLALDLFSPRNRTLVVQKNTSPLPGNFVTGSTGEPFVALSDYSWIVKVNDSARDLIAKIELPYDPEKMQRKGCSVANTYVGTLSGDGKSWLIDESKRNVHMTENKTRIIKLTSLDGEYMLLGRQTADTANIFVQYGFGATRTVNLTGGAGDQQAEFVDGLRPSVASEKKMQLNANLKFGIDQEAIPKGMRSLNSFAWAINSMNTALLPSSNSSAFAKTTSLMVAKRDLNASPTAAFKRLGRSQQKVSCNPECQIEVSNLQQLDGEYVIIAAEKAAGKHGTEKDTVREPTSGAVVSSVGATLFRNSGWVWMLLCFSVYGAL